MVLDFFSGGGRSRYRRQADPRQSRIRRAWDRLLPFRVHAPQEREHPRPRATAKRPRATATATATATGTGTATATEDGHNKKKLRKPKVFQHFVAIAAFICLWGVGAPGCAGPPFRFSHYRKMIGTHNVFKLLSVKTYQKHKVFSTLSKRCRGPLFTSSVVLS